MSPRSGGIFDFDNKVERLEEVNRELESPQIWNEPEKALALGKERASLDKTVSEISGTLDGLGEALEYLELAEMENDEGIVESVTRDVAKIAERVEKLEFRRMFSGE